MRARCAAPRAPNPHPHHTLDPKPNPNSNPNARPILGTLALTLCIQTLQPDPFYSTPDLALTLTLNQVAELRATLTLTLTLTPTLTPTLTLTRWPSCARRCASSASATPWWPSSPSPNPNPNLALTLTPTLTQP